MSSKYKFGDPAAPHFVTFSTIQWVDALSRPQYKDIIIDSLKYCQGNKGLIIHAYVVMSNHIHLILSVEGENNLSDIMRDFKTYTSKTLLATIESNTQESRRSWMMWLFKAAGQRNANNKYYQFWQQDNRPKELSSNAMMEQKLDYIHENPVNEGLVYEPEGYVYSSAIDYSGGKGLLDVELLV